MVTAQKVYAKFVVSICKMSRAFDSQAEIFILCRCKHETHFIYKIVCALWIHMFEYTCDCWHSSCPHQTLISNFQSLTNKANGARRFHVLSPSSNFFSLRFKKTVSLINFKICYGSEHRYDSNVGSLASYCLLWVNTTSLSQTMLSILFLQCTQLYTMCSIALTELAKTYNLHFYCLQLPSYHHVQGKLTPGMSLKITVEFSANEHKHYEDFIKIHCEVCGLRFNSSIQNLLAQSTLLPRDTNTWH